MATLDRPRSERPVFIVGSPRSGTTLLYHTLLSAGGFVVYRTESRVFDLLGPKFGGLRTRRNRERMLKVWLRSYKYRRSGLDAGDLRAQVLERCGSPGDFLRILMSGMAEKQGMGRWAECTPMNALYVGEIHGAFPEALFVHIIRDGRDVALSLERLGWISPLSCVPTPSCAAEACYWRWITGIAERKLEALDPSSVLRIRYEELVTRPRETLRQLASFLGHPLDYERIRERGIGSVKRPESSFAEEEFSPVERFKRLLEPREQRELSELIGDRLSEFGYVSEHETASGWRQRVIRALYSASFNLKRVLKSRTPLSRILVDLSDLRQPGAPS